MIITIDGRAATKKSPVAFLLSNKLDFKHVNSGLLYRALAIEVLELRKESKVATASFFLNLIPKLRFNDYKLQWLGSGVEKEDNGKVTIYPEERLTSPDVTLCASELSLNSIVREEIQTVLVNEMTGSDVVTDGRDMGTEVVPEADLKFFFEASFEARVNWRHKYEGIKHGESLTAVSISLKSRDADSFWIKPADDAIIVNVDELSVAEIADIVFNDFVMPFKLRKLRPAL